MEYSFNIEHAQKYGVDEAIMIKNFSFWISKNKANKTNIHDGRAWTYNSLSALTNLFPFWTEKQIRRIINSLIKQKVLLSGNYNKSAYDRTKWYAFIEESIFLFGNNHLPKWSNQNDQKAQPIPYNKPDNKPDNKEKIKKEEDKVELIETLNDRKRKLLYEWLDYRVSIKKPVKTKKAIEMLVRDFHDHDYRTLENCVKKSIVNEYQGLFIKKEKFPSEKEKSFDEKMREYIYGDD